MAGGANDHPPTSTRCTPTTSKKSKTAAPSWISRTAAVYAPATTVSKRTSSVPGGSMRAQQLPLLSSLPVGVTIQRCDRCGLLALQRELCATHDEEIRCKLENMPQEGSLRN